MRSLERVASALDSARSPVRLHIRRVLATTNVVGLHGPSQVGKSTILRQALRDPASPWGDPLIVDLADAYSSGQLQWILLRGLARVIAGPSVFSQMTELDQSAWPSEVRSAALAVGRELGDLTDMALDNRGAPAGLDNSLGEILEIVGRIARSRPLSLVVEHLEAPGLTPRHSVDVEELLWQVRAVAQRRRKLQVIMTARFPAVSLAAGPHSAFHRDGRWIALDAPDRTAWLHVAHRLGPEYVDGASSAIDLCAGHVPTMLALLADDRGRTGSEMRAAFDEMVGERGPYVARCLEHARTLHRLGATLLTHIGADGRPYSAIPSGHPKEVGRALQALALAGLIHQPEPRRWQVTDPVVARALRRRLFRHSPDPLDDRSVRL